MLLSEGYAHYFTVVTGLKWHWLEKNVALAPDSYVVTANALNYTNSSVGNDNGALFCPPRHVIDVALCNRPTSQKTLFKELRKIALSFMKISRIDVEFLKNFDSLVHLDLSCNFIDENSGRLELQFPESLEEVNLSGNILVQIPRVEKLKRLRHLNLSHNCISSINTNLEKDLPKSIISLNLAFNHLIEPKALSIVASVESLKCVSFAGNLPSLDYRYSKWIKAFFSGRWLDGTKISDLQQHNPEAASQLEGQSFAKIAIYFGSMYGYPKLFENPWQVFDLPQHSSSAEKSVELAGNGTAATGKYELKYSAEFLGRSTELYSHTEADKVEFNQLLEMKIELNSIAIRDQFLNGVDFKIFCHLMCAENSTTVKGNSKGKQAKGMTADVKAVPLASKLLFSVRLDVSGLLVGETTIGYLPCVRHGALGIDAFASEVCVMRDVEAPQVDLSTVQQLFAATGLEVSSSGIGASHLPNKKNKKRE